MLPVPLNVRPPVPEKIPDSVAVLAVGDDMTPPLVLIVKSCAEVSFALNCKVPPSKTGLSVAPRPAKVFDPEVISTKLGVGVGAEAKNFLALLNKS